jgi:hypothetical protein
MQLSGRGVNAYLEGGQFVVVRLVVVTAPFLPVAVTHLRFFRQLALRAERSK